MATRFYLPSAGAADVSPAFDASWTNSALGDRIKCVVVKTGSAMTDKAGSTGSAVTSHLANRQYVSDPIAAQTITGTVKGQIRASEVNASDDIRANISIRVVSNDGSTVRGTLKALDTTTGAAPASEFAASLTNRKHPWVSTSSSLSSVAAQDGDRLVIEIGCTRNFTSLRAGTQNFGDADAADLPEDETTTTANNPWIEFSQDIAFQAAPRPLPPPLPFGRAELNPRMTPWLLTRGLVPDVVVINGIKDLGTATVNGVATVSANIVKTAAITPATVNGVATVSATIVKTAKIAPATVNGVATVSATVVAIRRIAPATVNGVATVSSTIVAIRRIAPATVNGVATVSSTIVVTRRITPATVNGLTTVSATVVVTRRILPATVNGQTSVSVVLTRIAGSTVPERPLLGAGL